MSAPGPGPAPAPADANLEDGIVDQFAKTDIRQSTPSEQPDIHADVAAAAAAAASSSSAATKPAHNRRASTLGNDPFAYLQLHRNDTLVELEKYKDAVIVEPTYTSEEKAQMEELRNAVGAMIADPEKMKCGPDDYPSGQHQHWTNYWPQGRDHPQFVDNYAHLDKDPSLWPEHELIRFLRARDYNMKKAVKMYFQYRRWRIVFGVTHLASFTTMPFEPLIQSILSHSYHKNDKSGRPLYIQRSGLIDPHRFATEVSLEQISIGHTWFSEEMAKRAELGSRITGKRVTQLVNIIDIKDVGLAARKMLKIFSTTSHIDQNFYPETLGALYIINSPSFFPVFWNICKTFLAPKTQEKVNIIGSNYGPILLEALGPDCLPVEYGGECVCEGGCCPPATGPNYARPGEDSAEEENFTIKAGSSVTHEICYQHLISYPDDEGGDEFQECWYNIDLSAKDIDYSITFTPSVNDSSAPVEVIPLTRISHGQPTTGIYSGSQSGMIRILLSNEYSRWSSKAVKLRYGTRPKQGQQ